MIRTSLLALLALAACSRPGGSSPEDVFEKSKVAAEKKEWKALYACFDPQESDAVLSSVMIVAAFATMGKPDAEKEVDAIVQKHGMKKSEDSVSSGDRQAMKKAAAEAFAPVKDKAAFFADIMTLIEKHSKDGSVSFVKGSLKDVKVAGDKATASVDRGDGQSQSMRFVKRDGRWYIAME